MSMRHIVAGAPGLFAHRLCACSRIGCAPLRGSCFFGPASRAVGRERWIIALLIQCCINVTPAARAGCSPRRFAARGRRAVARLLMGPKGSSMPIVRDPPSPLKYIGVPQKHPLDLDLDTQGW